RSGWSVAMAYLPWSYGAVARTVRRTGPPPEGSFGPPAPDLGPRRDVPGAAAVARARQVWTGGPMGIRNAGTHIRNVERPGVVRTRCQFRHRGRRRDECTDAGPAPDR